MGSLLGFRGPHFSEDNAWLPGWLQHHDGKLNSESISDEQFCFEKRIEEMQILQGNSNEGGHKSFRLFLSGNSSSALSSVPSTQNVVNFHLHLSTDDNSQNIPSLTIESSKSERPLINQTLEALVSPDKECISPNIESEEERIKLSEALEISNSIELSIAASEAMVIHEEISKSLSPSAVLEVALQLKEARLKVWKESTQCSIEESNEDDGLSDLDDLTMIDAYNDVGLSVTSSDNENLSYEENVVPETVEFTNPIFEDVLVHNNLQDSAIKSCDNEMENILTEDLNVSASIEKAKGGDLSQVISSSHVVNISEDAGKGNEVLSTVSDRFQSRWLGGWTWKDLKSSGPAEKNDDKSIHTPLNRESSFVSESTEKVSLKKDKSSVPTEHNDKFIPKTFMRETSFFSESAEIPLDESSVVKKQDFASQSSLPSQNCHTKINYEIPVSQDIMNSPSFDTLCSNVPCSISLENGSGTSSVNQDNEGFTRGCLEQITENVGVNVQKDIDSDNMLLHGEELIVPDSIEGSNHEVLRTYSRVFPRQKQNYCDKPSITKSNSKVDLEDCGGTTKDATPDCSKTSPLILNRRTRNCLQVNNVLINEVINPQIVPPKKLVRFSETEIIIPQNDKLQEQLESTTCDNRRSSKKIRRTNTYSESRAQDTKRLLFLNMEFLLSGYSGLKEKEIEKLIKTHGGSVLSNIPYPPTPRVKRNSRLQSKALPIILCTKKNQTIKFLYGCAVHAHMLKVKWLTDSIAAGHMLPPQKYTILRNYAGKRHSRIKKAVYNDGHPSIFDNIGIMLLGKSSFCNGMSKVVKHGGGQIFKALQWLVQSLETEKIFHGVIVAEDETRISRHLKQCALEQNIPVVPAYWIIRSLHRGKLLPLEKNKTSTPLPSIKPLDCPDSFEMSLEI